MSSFKDLRIVDNFYQTSAFFPMPTVLISTIADDGNTTLGAYSLCFPYYIAGKDYYAMLLECRNSSNTAQNLLKRGVCAINFIEDDKGDFKEAVRLGTTGRKCIGYYLSVFRKNRAERMQIIHLGKHRFKARIITQLFSHTFCYIQCTHGIGALFLMICSVKME